MKTHITAFLLGTLVMFHSPDVLSALNYDPSGGVVGESRLLPTGETHYYLYYNHQSYGPQYNGQFDTHLVGGFRVGLTQKLEVGLGLPLRANPGEDNAGLPFIMATARMQLAEFNQGQQHLFLTLYRSTGELQGQPALTSGQPNQGLFLSLYNDEGGFATRYLLGSSRSDVRYYTAGSGGYAEGRRYQFSAGARFGELSRQHIWLDLIVHYDQSVAGQNYYGYLAPTFEFPNNKGRTLFLGMAWGVPKDNAAPLLQVSIGFSYRPPRSPHIYTQLPVPAEPEAPQTESAGATGNSSAGQDAHVTGDGEGQASDMVTIDGSGSAETPPAAVASEESIGDGGCKANVEIMYFSGQQQRARALAEELKSQGYCIVSLQAQNLPLLQSELYIRQDTEEESAQQVMAIAGAKQLSTRQLPWGTDMRIILGKY